MIRRLTLRRFKRFDELDFTLPGHVVLAGPNNTGKTTLPQALAAWDLALRRWRERNDFKKHGGAYAKAPIARQAFSAVPVRSFDLLWREREVGAPVEIAVQTDRGQSLAMELLSDTTEQVLVRPARDVPVDVARGLRLSTVYVPPMTGLQTEEPLYARREFVDMRLAEARPGEVLRNVLVEIHGSETAWRALTDGIRRLFGYELLPPDATAAYIAAEYRARKDGPAFDIASAGSGFQQVLMLLAQLHSRPGSVLLLDEPDAHLHVILQDAIYGELRAVAARNDSQLVIATHSEVVIDSVDARELCVLLDRPRLLDDRTERASLKRALAVLSNVDVMLALDAPGVLYVEGWTDLETLRAWASVLDHPAKALLTTRLFWKPVVSQPRDAAAGVQARDHYDALKLVRSDLPALEILDGDGNRELPETPLEGRGLQRVRWRRYEVESYLLHPAALERFVERQVGSASAEARKALRGKLDELLSGAAEDFVQRPLDPPALVESYLKYTKARTDILPPLLNAAGLPGFPYTRYHEIAALMTPEEIHPEVREKLDAIVAAFGP